MNKEIATALSYFNSISTKDWFDRKKRKPIVKELSSVIASYSDYGHIFPIVCTLSNKVGDMQLYDKIIEMWMSACTIAKHYNVKIIYKIEETTYVVCPDSNTDMMVEIMDTPKFYKEIDPYFSDDIVSFESFYDNTYVIMYTKPKQVGPYRMPKITKTYMEYATSMNIKENTIKKYEKKIEEEKNVIARSKEDFYAFLGKNCKLSEDDIMKVEVSDIYSYEKVSKCARTIWRILNGIIKYNNPKKIYEIRKELMFVVDHCKRHHLWDEYLITQVIKALTIIANNKAMGKQFKVLFGLYNTMIQ